MNSFPKFIIEDGNLIISKCKFHNQLVKDTTKVRGGGWFKYADEDKSFTLYGDSYEFGAAKIEDIKKAIDDGQVYLNSRRTREISGKHIFKYNTGSEIIQLN